MSHEDFETEMLARSGAMLAEMASNRTEIHGLVLLLERHERQDAERFMLLHERISKAELNVDKLEDADTSQRIEAIDKERASLKAKLDTRDQRSFTVKHGIALAVLSVVLSACGSVVTALLLRGGG